METPVFDASRPITINLRTPGGLKTVRVRFPSDDEWISRQRRRKVLVKEYQLDPIDHKLLHADFFAVAMDKMLTVTVPILLKGEPKGVKQQGGIVDFVNREIEVQCLPSDIPEHIDIDISELMLHQGIRVRDLPQDAKWKAISEPDMMVVHVVTLKVEEAPAVEAAAAATPGAVPAEPEVIKKGKKDEDEEKAEKKEKK